MLFDIIVSFLCAASASLGIGGGGLLVIYLTQFKGLMQKEAQGINLLFFVITMSVTLLFHRLKNRVITDNLLILLVPCMLGGVLGSLVARFIGQEILKSLFGSFLVICGSRYLIMELKGKKKQ